MIQSSDSKKIRRTSSYLSAIQSEPEIHRSYSAPSGITTLSFTNACQDLPDDLPSTVPQSAPAFVMAPVFLWPPVPQNKPPPGAQFYEWSNEHTKASPSSSWHLDDEGGGAPGNRIGRNRGYPSSSLAKLNRRYSADETVAKEKYNKWQRKPPFHLPPLDPGVFEKKSKSPKAASPNGKKSKRRLKRHKATESSAEICQEKREEDVKQATKEEDGLRTGKDQCVEEICYPEKAPSEKSHHKKDKSPTTSACDPISRHEFQMLNHSVDRGNDDLCFEGTLKKMPATNPDVLKARPPRPRRTVVYSVEQLPSLEEINSLAANSKGFSTLKMRSLKHSSLPSIPSSSSMETTGYDESASRYPNKPKILVKVPRERPHECDRGIDDSIRRGEKPTGRSLETPPSLSLYQPDGFGKVQSHAVKATGQDKSLNGPSDKPGILLLVRRETPRECDSGVDASHKRGEKPGVRRQEIPNFQQANGLTKEESQVVEEVMPRRSSQAVLSFVNGRANRRVRRTGVCNGAEHTSMKNDRTHARVLMKRFGQLNVTE